MNGGYLIISKNQADAYALSLKALELGKPVLFYEDDTTCYYIDTITLSGTDVVLTKGGKTITIESDGTITEVGDVLTIMENIVDKYGNKRFIDFEGITSEIAGVTFTYNKASLSGTHLMLVFSCDLANTSIIANNQVIVKYDLPDYINDKIKTIFGTSSILYKDSLAIADDNSNQAFNVLLNKTATGVEIAKFTTTTLTANRSVRIQIDLVIDAE